MWILPLQHVIYFVTSLKSDITSFNITSNCYKSYKMLISLLPVSDSCMSELVLKHASVWAVLRSKTTRHRQTPTCVSKAVFAPSVIFARFPPTWFHGPTVWLTTAVMDIFVSSQLDDSETFLRLGDRPGTEWLWCDELATTASFVAAAIIAKLLSKSGILGCGARFADEVDGIGSSRIRALTAVRTVKNNNRSI